MQTAPNYLTSKGSFQNERSPPDKIRNRWLESDHRPRVHLRQCTSVWRSSGKESCSDRKSRPRISSRIRHSAQAVADVVNSYGIDTHMFDVSAPTPACSFAVVDHKAANGVMITASHNPPEWNGFKVKSSAGGSATPTEVGKIEEHLADVLDGKGSGATGESGSNTVFDVIAPYLEQLHRVIDVAPIKKQPLKVVVDAMHGSGAGIIPQMLAGGAIEVTEIRSDQNPNFPGMDQPEPIEHNLIPLSEAVKELGADIGIALDGDADRVGIVDENGRYLTTLEVFSLLTDHFMGRRNERGGVACTITMSSMVDKLSAHYGAPIYRTPVGRRRKRRIRVQRTRARA
jgi:phosphomannomutase